MDNFNINKNSLKLVFKSPPVVGVLCIHYPILEAKEYFGIVNCTSLLTEFWPSDMSDMFGFEGIYQQYIYSTISDGFYKVYI